MRSARKKWYYAIIHLSRMWTQERLRSVDRVCPLPPVRLHPVCCKQWLLWWFSHTAALKASLAGRDKTVPSSTEETPHKARKQPCGINCWLIFILGIVGVVLGGICLLIFVVSIVIALVPILEFLLVLLQLFSGSGYHWKLIPNKAAFLLVLLQLLSGGIPTHW